MFIEKFVNSPVNSNSYVLYTCGKRGTCIIVDPGSKSIGELLNFLKLRELIPDLIILTHEHFDHCWGINELSQHFSFSLVASNFSSIAIKDPKKNLSFFLQNEAFSVHHEVTTIESLDYRLKWQDKVIKFNELKGHSKGSIGFKIDDVYFIGDTLILDAPTITKLPGGDKKELLKSVSWLRKNLSPETMIYSGHGDSFFLSEYQWVDTIRE